MKKNPQMKLTHLHFPPSLGTATPSHPAGSAQPFSDSDVNLELEVLTLIPTTSPLSCTLPRRLLDVTAE